MVSFLVFASVLKFNTTNISDVAWTWSNYESVFNKGATTSAMRGAGRSAQRSRVASPWPMAKPSSNMIST